MGRKLKFLALLLMFLSLLAPQGTRARSAGSDLKSDLEIDIEENGGDSDRSESTSSRRSTGGSGGGGAAVDVDSRIDLAQSQVDRKLYDEAIKTLRPVNDHLPRSGLLLLAKAYAGKKDSLGELKTLELCIVKNPKDYVVKTAYGNALLRVPNRSDDALNAFHEARTMNPRYRPAYDALLAALEKKGERFEARNLVEDMRSKFGENDPKLLTTLCRLYALDDYNEATKNICEKAIERASGVAENHMYLGLALMNLEKMDEAKRVLVNATQQFPSSEPVQWALGELAMSKKDSITAYNYFRRASRADSKSSRAWLGLARASFELQKLDESLQAFVKACTIDKTQIKDFRGAIGTLRVRKDTTWQLKFEMGINGCH